MGQLKIPSKNILMMTAASQQQTEYPVEKSVNGNISYKKQTSTTQNPNRGQLEKFEPYCNWYFLWVQLRDIEIYVGLKLLEQSKISSRTNFANDNSS